MPELPDIELYRAALAERILGRTVERVRVAGPAWLRSVDPPLAEAAGRRVEAVRRLGKRVVLGLAGDLFLVLHLRVAGRLRWRPRGPGSPPPALAGRGTLGAVDFAEGSLVVTEAGPKKRASLHLVRGEAGLAALDPGGLEPLAADAAAFAARLRAERHTVKRALTDPRLFAGIGNAYSDEILHRARLSPFRLTTKLDDGELARLFGATQAERIAYAENEANYCARCQTAGRLLADRALSRLLREDWPRTLDELEERRERAKAG